MKILVPIKRVLDYNIKPRIKQDGTGVDLDNVKMSMNPFDEIAIEEAVRLKEKSQATDIIAVTIGTAQSVDVIRTALAMGADRGIHILTDIPIEPLAVAKILQHVTQEEKPDLILCGKQAIDDDYNQTGQMLAGLLQVPQACFASQITVKENTLVVTREIDGGEETIEVMLPAIVTTDLRLNEPRYTSLPNIMKAKKKPIETIDLTTLNIDCTPKLKIITTEEPPKRQGGTLLETIPELVTILRDKGFLNPREAV